MSYLRALIFSLPLAVFPGLALAQTASVAFGAVKADPSLPVEVTADNLAVNQADGSAEFTGNVLIVQGVMRLSADTVLVIYKTAEESGGEGGIERLEATGNVVLVSGPDAAESQYAEYTIDRGTVVMTGNVLLNQENGTLASNRLEVNLTSGTAQMAGRVKTILNPNGGSN
ncbi:MULTISPECIES: LptA/OstA family protein [unclassified Leisingera]|uniref:LptA/OstA family protein n=1 Tax=unclassified Leisingera TaxID=2614906 RepID=UPI0005808735|nr:MULTISPECIES: LptA/OstA family protein [unclassified Leisingera]KIC35988.1 organic solvent tolerance protein OstA [Leisingera sp. ANG-M7]OBY26409.1 lipopolysaccharide transport periplasmic protein LptA [Leisingera sp. JC1]